MARILFIAFMCFSLTGCIEVTIQRSDNAQPPVVEEVVKPEEEWSTEPVVAIGDAAGLSPQLQKVRNAFDAITDQKDRLTIHKLFSGAADYLAVCEELDNTAQFDPILGRVQSTYGWDREKYPALTDAVSEYLVSVKYDDPKALKTPAERQAFAKIFKDLSEATKYE